MVGILGRAGGKSWGVDMIQIHCGHIWYFQIINYLKFSPFDIGITTQSQLA